MQARHPGAGSASTDTLSVKYSVVGHKECVQRSLCQQMAVCLPLASSARVANQTMSAVVVAY